MCYQSEDMIDKCILLITTYVQSINDTYIADTLIEALHVRLWVVH